MEIAELVERLESQGATLTVNGDKVRLHAPAAPSPEVLERLRSEKQALIAYLEARHEAEAIPDAQSDGWPPECRQSRERFGQAHVVLFPLIGKRVRTPHGAGVLEQVFAERCTVLLDTAPERLARFHWTQIGLDA